MCCLPLLFFFLIIWWLFNVMNGANLGTGVKKRKVDYLFIGYFMWTVYQTGCIFIFHSLSAFSVFFISQRPLCRKANAHISHTHTRTD